MTFKKDTKEKFTVYTPEFSHFTANMAVHLAQLISENTSATTAPHVIINASPIIEADAAAIAHLLQMQQDAYAQNHSFVLCEVSKSLQPLFQDSLNMVPTESEAWDIVQMEEIERELLGDIDD